MKIVQLPDPVWTPPYGRGFLVRRAGADRREPRQRPALSDPYWVMAKLSTDEIAPRLQQLPSWTLDGNAIKRQYVFDGFASAVAFVVRIGFDAEAADHHPDVLISNYKKVTLTFTTHSDGGLTEKDFAAAQKADRVFVR